MMLQMAGHWLQRADELEHAGSQQCLRSGAPLASMRGTKLERSESGRSDSAK